MVGCLAIDKFLANERFGLPRRLEKSSNRVGQIIPEAKACSEDSLLIAALEAGANRLRRRLVASVVDADFFYGAVDHTLASGY
jgi:hypothetical protein